MRVERAEDYYHDESGERFLQVYRTAVNQQDSKKAARQQIVFWGFVVAFCIAIVFGKLYTMGAIAGTK